MKRPVRRLIRPGLLLAGVIMGSLSSPASGEELSGEVLSILQLEDGWVSTENPRKCANIPITPDTELYPDLHVSRAGFKFDAETSWESGDKYEVTRIRAEWPTQVVLEASMSGSGEGMAWTGRSLWFVNYPWDGSGEPNGPLEARVAKATSLTIVTWQESTQSDGQDSAQPVKDPVPGASTYVRCSQTQHGAPE
ncbi:hypothetical protein DK847_20005 [Aestuariivirga litoralis]|uniref:Secreted protein n=1 Tax=Aestuariivirga litoralis TaxID=2650924 RepID=A0A2W2B4D7_9HYPH|nr:hypothetical protein DK847_20005 [Aestuariivirga litoralis]